MGSFAYEARNMEGDLVTGMINAASIEDAGRKLGDQEIFVIKLAPADDGLDTPVRRKGTAGKGVSASDVMWFISQLAIMIETGINLSEALDCIARQCTRERMKPVLEGIARSVREGRALSDALEMYPRAFMPTIIALIRSSEMSGTLSGTLNRVSQYLHKEQEITRRVRSALVYPLFMFTLCIGVTIFLMTVILPRFAEIFADRGAQLPGPTLILMSISDILVTYAYYWIALVLTTGIGTWCWYRTALGRRQLDWLKLHLPLVGGVLNKLYQAKAFRTVGTLLSTGVPLVDVLQITRQVSSNIHFRELWEDVNNQVRSGERLATPLLRSPLVEESLAQMIDSGERSGRLGMVFNRLADFLEHDFDQAVRTAIQMIEPIMILVMGTLIGFIAIALLLPLFSTAQVVSG